MKKIKTKLSSSFREINKEQKFFLSILFESQVMKKKKKKNIILFKAYNFLFSLFPPISPQFDKNRKITFDGNRSLLKTLSFAMNIKINK